MGGKKQVDAAHIELIGRKGFAFAYFDKKPEEEDLLKKLKDLKVKERVCKVEVMRSPPRNSGSGDDMITEPKVKGIVAKEAKDKRTVERTSPTSQDEKVRSKKTSSGDEKPRGKKTSSSEGEDQAKRIKEPKPKSEIAPGKEKTAVNKTRPVKTARGT